MKILLKSIRIDDYYSSMNFVINQIIKAKVNNNMKSLYITGKIYELLSLCFSKSEDSSLRIVLLADEDNVRKIRNAKEIVLQNSLSHLH